MTRLAAALLSMLLLTVAPASAHHKLGHQIPPGLLKKLQPAPTQIVPSDVEDVCLVTTAEWRDPYADVVSTEWLPRPLAERLVEEEGGFIILHPALRTEEDCQDFLWEN